MAAICGGAALASATQAFAAGPTLSVSSTDSSLAGSGSTVVRFLDDGLDPTATIDVYSPGRYSVDLAQPFGSTIGGIEAQAKTTEGADVRLSGAVRTADPATYAQSAATCTPGRTAHDAVWTLALGGGGLTIDRIPVFVDRLPAGSGTARLRACLPQPGSVGFPIRLVRATVTLNGVFTNPAGAGEYRWTSLFTTYSAPGTPPLASQTIVRLPPRLTLTRRLIQPRGPRGRTFVRLAGRVTENGRPVRGVRVEVLSGPSASSLERLVYATSFTRGRFAVVAPLRGRTVFRARVAAPLRAGPLSQCKALALQPDAVCSSVTLAPFTAQSRSVTVGPPRLRPIKRRGGRVRP